MIKTLAVVLTLLGFISLTVGVLGIFGDSLVDLHPWALAILGLIFFSGGIGLLKAQER